jgi:predicted pyridoxine 5'-phosphate oxidase superfamily flavin-nucleotide-binding protein
MTSTVPAALPAEVIELLKDRSTLKVLATTDAQGNPHAVTKGSLTVLDGFLVYREALESSQTNANVLGSLWFDKRVAVLIVGNNGHAYQIKGSPHRYVINGPLFKQHYLEARDRHGLDSDIAGVWLIIPEEIRNETFSARKVEEDKKHPFLRHLDRESYHSGAQR